MEGASAARSGAETFPSRDANGEFCVQDLETYATGTATATYGSVARNAFPVASFQDSNSHVPAEPTSLATIADVDANPDQPRARQLGGCPSEHAVCVSSGYGGEYEWRDVLVRSIHWFPYDPVRVVNADP